MTTCVPGFSFSALPQPLPALPALQAEPSGLPHCPALPWEGSFYTTYASSGL